MRTNIEQLAENALKEARDFFGDIGDYTPQMMYKAGYALGFLHGTEDAVKMIKEEAHKWAVNLEE